MNYSDEQIDIWLDQVLRASGSARRHYSMQKTIDKMRAAMRKVINESQTGDSDGTSTEH